MRFRSSRAYFLLPDTSLDRRMSPFYGIRPQHSAVVRVMGAGFRNNLEIVGGHL